MNPANKSSKASRNSETKAERKASYKKRRADAINFVLSQDSLRELIVAHAICNDIFDVQNETRILKWNGIRSLRLVSKSWFQDVHKYLLRRGVPMIQIKTRQTGMMTPYKHKDINSISDYNIKLLSKYAIAFRESLQVVQRIPPFSLKISGDFLDEGEKNFEAFSDFMDICASGLVRLNMSFSGSVNGNDKLPNITKVDHIFPNLHAFIITTDPFSACPSDCDGASLIQPILSGSQRLKKLEISSFTFHDYGEPSGFRELTLPPTITDLNVTSFCKSDEFQVLLGYQLPHLRKLAFSIIPEPYTDGLVSKVLDKFKTSLRKIFIDDMSGNRTPPQQTVIRFPVMENLESLVVKSPFAELDDDHPPLQDMLPNLTKLNLPSLTFSQLQRWINLSAFPNISKLKLNLRCQNGGNENGAFKVGTHFPNLTHLTLYLDDEVGSHDLKHIFSSMPHLRELEIEMGECYFYDNADHWDSILTGIPIGMVGALRDNPEFWTHIHLREEYISSVRRMKELRTFHLSCSHCDSVNVQAKLISDLSFHFAFFHMPKLADLQLNGRLLPSSEIQRECEDRKISTLFVHHEPELHRLVANWP